MTVITRNHVVTAGAGHRPMIFAHGFGCDQNMWRLVAPAFEADHLTVLFDHVGATIWSRSVGRSTSPAACSSAIRSAP